MCWPRHESTEQCDDLAKTSIDFLSTMEVKKEVHVETPSTQPQDPKLNSAGDYSSRGVEIAPDDVSNFETQADELGEMHDIAPRKTLGGVTEKMAANERATRESIEAMRANKGLVNPSAESEVNTNWPVDE